MKSRHIILILSLSVITIGVVLMAISAINASRPFLNQSILVANDLVTSKQMKNAAVSVMDAGPGMYIVIKSDPPNIPLTAEVKDPNGLIVSSSTSSQNLVASFKADRVGKYQLVLVNEGTADVKVNFIVGRLPLLVENESPNYNAVGAIFTGALLLVLGCFGVAGAVFMYVENTRALSIDRAKKVIRYLNNGQILRRLASSAVHSGLIAERVRGLERSGRNQITEPKSLGRQEQFTEDDSSFSS